MSAKKNNSTPQRLTASGSRRMTQAPLLRVTKQNAAVMLRRLMPISRCLADAAVRQGYGVAVYTGTNMFRVSHKGKNVYVKGAVTPVNSYSSASIADNKYLTNALFSAAGIPVPAGLRLNRDQYKAGSYDLSTLRFPLVVKPLAGTVKGLGVVTNVLDPRSLQQVLKSAFRLYKRVLIEEFYGGFNDYRVLVLDHKVIAVLHRIPAYVVGDGRSSLRQLIREKNVQRALSKKAKLGSISVDLELRNTIKSQQLSLRSVPQKGQRVQLKNVCNLGAGGEVHDVTDQIHPENVRIAAKATKAIGLRLAGLDFLCGDIAKPLARTGGVILEVNQHPDIAMHYAPTEGPVQDVASHIVKAFFRS